MKKNMFSLKKLSTKTIVIMILVVIFILCIGMCYYTPLQEGATNNTTGNTTSTSNPITCTVTMSGNYNRLYDSRLRYLAKMNNKFVNNIKIIIVNNTMLVNRAISIPTVKAVINNKTYNYNFPRTGNKDSIVNWVKSLCNNYKP